MPKKIMNKTILGVIGVLFTLFGIIGTIPILLNRQYLEGLFITGLSVIIGIILLALGVLSGLASLILKMLKKRS